MKYLLFALLLTGCAETWFTTQSPAWQCRNWVCPTAALHEQVGVESDRCSYDEIDDSCLCRFRNGQIYITPRR